MKLSEIVKILDLDLEELPDLEIKRCNTLKDSKEGELSFLENKNYINELQQTKASAVLVSKNYLEYVPKGVKPIVTETPYIDLAKLSRYFSSPIEVDENNKIPPKIGDGSRIGENVYLGSGVEIGSDVRIMHNSYIGDNVRIDDNTIIYPNVTIYKETIIGKNVIIHSGTVIGSDGFGFATDKSGRHIKIYQNGNVVIEDMVEIGSNVSIDRAVFNSTYIREGARIDNLVQIGHNCDIGANSVLVSQVGIAGSTELGRNVVIGGQAGLAGHIKIAPWTTITAKAGVTKTIKEGGKIWSGFPLFEHRHWLKLQAKISKLI